MSEFYVIGLMSGTSLDGLDLAYCRFEIDEGAARIAINEGTGDSGVRFELIATETVSYSTEWTHRLAALDKASALDYALAHAELGHFFGVCVREFMMRHPGRVDFVASHGHTVFHQPQRGLTAQIADIDAIAAECGVAVVGGFRTMDVALGGQGAPLVPVGDRLLFGQYEACLNLGGFSNISFECRGRRWAFDVSPCNMALNDIARRMGLAFDKDGAIARGGHLEPFMLGDLDKLPYYAALPPKSLGKEWYDKEFVPVVEYALDNGLCYEDVMATLVEHIAHQVGKAVWRTGVSSMLLTGGGAHNGYLVERMRKMCIECELTVPEPAIVDYKEAILFALLGCLRVIGLPNALASSTGAKTNSVSGLLSAVPPIV